MLCEPITNDAVWIENVFLRSAFVKVGIRSDGILEIDDLNVDHFRNIDAIVEHRLQQLAIVLLHRTLTSNKRQ